MGRRKPVTKAEFVLYNVLYQDGAQTSNRKVATAALDPFNEEDSAIAALETQDREIAERSGRPRGPIKSIDRV